MCLHNLDQCQKVSKGEVLTLEGERPSEVVVTHVFPRQSVTLTGAVKHDSNAELPFQPLKRVLAKANFALRANSSVLYQWAESEADFYSPAVTPRQRVPPP